MLRFESLENLGRNDVVVWYRHLGVERRQQVQHHFRASYAERFRFGAFFRGLWVRLDNGDDHFFAVR
jgi:hypothetical protein